MGFIKYSFRAENYRLDRLIWIFTLETFDFLFNPLFLDIPFPTTCIKNTFDYKYRYDATSTELITDWTKVSCSQAGF